MLVVRKCACVVVHSTHHDTTAAGNFHAARNTAHYGFTKVDNNISMGLFRCLFGKFKFRYEAKETKMRLRFERAN